MEPATKDANYAKRHSATGLARWEAAYLQSADLADGFDFGSERIPLVNPQRGIFEPRQAAGWL